MIRFEHLKITATLHWYWYIYYIYIICNKKITTKVKKYKNTKIQLYKWIILFRSQVVWHMLYILHFSLSLFALSLSLSLSLPISCLQHKCTGKHIQKMQLWSCSKGDLVFSSVKSRNPKQNEKKKSKNISISIKKI